MRRRLVLSTSLIALVSVIVLGVPLGFVGTSLLRQRAQSRLERRADTVALKIDAAIRHRRAVTAALLAGTLPRGEAVRVRRDGRTTTLGTMPRGPVTTIRAGGPGVAEVALIAPTGALSDDTSAVWLAVAALGTAALLAGALLANLQARRLTGPLARLTAHVARVGDPGFTAPYERPSTPELAKLQAALADANERIGALMQSEREFTANASHQLRSPLTGLQLRLEELERLAADPETAAEVAAATAQADRLQRTIEHLGEIARLSDAGPISVPIAPLITEYLEREGWRRRFARAGRRLDARIDGTPVVAAPPETIRQILDVLLDNALSHGNGDTHIELIADADVAGFSVSDEGALSAPDADVFVRGVGHGSGIGLAVARELAARGGGSLELEPGPGTRFAARFPVSRASRVVSPRPEIKQRDFHGPASGANPGPPFRPRRV